MNLIVNRQKSLVKYTNSLVYRSKSLENGWKLIHNMQNSLENDRKLIQNSANSLVNKQKPLVKKTSHHTSYKNEKCCTMQIPTLSILKNSGQNSFRPKIISNQINKNKNNIFLFDIV